MTKRLLALLLCLILALSLLTACGSTEISGKSEPKGGTDSSSKALQSLTYELHTEGQLQSGYTIRYDENGLAEELDYISDGKTESAPVDYTFDDKGSPVSPFSTENTTFSAEFSIEYGVTTTVSVASCTFNNEMFTDFSDSSRTAPIMTSFLLFRLIDQFDGFRNATLSVPGTDIEQRVEDGETVYSSTAYNDFSTRRNSGMKPAAARRPLPRWSWATTKS